MQKEVEQQLSQAVIDWCQAIRRHEEARHGTATSTQVAMSTAAPPSSSTLTTAAWPWLDARISAVLPGRANSNNGLKERGQWGERMDVATHNRTRDQKAEAANNGEREKPATFLCSIAAPNLSNRFTTKLCPNAAACIKGVSPKAVVVST